MIVLGKAQIACKIKDLEGIGFKYPKAWRKD